MTKILTTLALIAGVTGCSVDGQVPSHQSTFILDTTRFPVLLDEMDRALLPFGLTRVEAVPGLKELQGRDVLFAAYLSTAPLKKTALDLTDVMEEGKITLRVYVDFTPNQEQRKSFLRMVSTVVEQFGGSLRTNGRG